MKIIHLKFFFLVFFILIFSLNYSYAAKKSIFDSKKNIFAELLFFTKDTNGEKLNEKIKNITKVAYKKPKPRKYRNIIQYEFNKDIISKYTIPKNIAELNENQFKAVKEFDLNNNGIIDTIVDFNDPITAYLDINENGIHEIEYIFNGSERYIYYDENEDKKFDYAFVDYNIDGVDEEIIKIEN